MERFPICLEDLQTVEVTLFFKSPFKRIVKWIQKFYFWKNIYGNAHMNLKYLSFMVLPLITLKVLDKNITENLKEIYIPKFINNIFRIISFLE